MNNHKTSFVAHKFNGNQIGAGETISASDFVSSSSGSSDSGKVPKLNTAGKLAKGFLSFGGDGSDGALSITSGTTTLSCSNASYFVKNYTSISITGTGKLAFSDPHANGTVIVLKSQGDVTLTSSSAPMIDASGMGAAGATAPTAPTASGPNGSNGLSYGGLYKTNAGNGAATNAVGAASSVGVFAVLGGLTALSKIASKYSQAFVGAGAGAGSCVGGSVGSGGDGGRGGGALIIECGGSWNFTTASGISVAGLPGGNASAGSNNFSGGGGGGGGGFFLALYNLLTANTGTVTVSGGIGGNCAKSGVGSTYGGGGGGSLISGGNAGTTSTTSGAKTGGDGGSGLYLIAENTEYAS